MHSCKQTQNKYTNATLPRANAPYAGFTVAPAANNKTIAKKWPVLATGKVAIKIPYRRSLLLPSWPCLLPSCRNRHIAAASSPSATATYRRQHAETQSHFGSSRSCRATAFAADETALPLG
ncbi:hypothetical protein NPIL_448401 [Nephila pilipes]|uniref:Uncharacterized protein n=1 Tax=Nephila pilipes TaxID=299642 RepID=A0A8X6KHS7_NEPPI|nr:hypothetical protein NPIL_448401 [Nephila pilipes]